MRPMLSPFGLLLGTVPPAALVAALACGKDTTLPTPVEGLRVETVVTGLDTPWDLAWGPDGQIWVTERGGRVSRVNPATGQRR